MVIFTGLTGFDMDDIMGHNLIWRGMTRRCHGCFNWFEEFQKGDQFLDSFEEAIRSPLNASFMSSEFKYEAQLSTSLVYLEFVFVSPPQYIRCLRRLRLKKIIGEFEFGNSIFRTKMFSKLAENGFFSQFPRRATNHYQV